MSITAPRSSSDLKTNYKIKTIKYGNCHVALVMRLQKIWIVFSKVYERALCAIRLQPNSTYWLALVLQNEYSNQKYFKDFSQFGTATMSCQRKMFGIIMTTFIRFFQLFYVNVYNSQTLCIPPLHCAQFIFKCFHQSLYRYFSHKNEQFKIQHTTFEYIFWNCSSHITH